MNCALAFSFANATSFFLLPHGPTSDTQSTTQPGGILRKLHGYHPRTTLRPNCSGGHWLPLELLKKLKKRRKVRDDEKERKKKVDRGRRLKELEGSRVAPTSYRVTQHCLLCVDEFSQCRCEHVVCQPRLAHAINVHQENSRVDVSRRWFVTHRPRVGWLGRVVLRLCVRVRGRYQGRGRCMGWVRG
jgi:hypothetical protein